MNRGYCQYTYYGTYEYLLTHVGYERACLDIARAKCFARSSVSCVRYPPAYRICVTVVSLDF